MYNVGGKLLNGINSMDVYSVVCVIVKGGDSECFRIDNGVRQRCITPVFLSVCTWTQQCKNCNGDGEDGRF